jgi:hypothetical protein
MQDAQAGGRRFHMDDQKTAVRAALTELADAAGLSLQAIDDAAMGPWGLVRALLKELPRDALVAALPSFAGTWLDMVVRDVQGVVVDGQVILSGVLPPAKMLTLQGASETDQAVLAGGATVAIHPPDNELLILSPAGPNAAVYVVSAEGLSQIALNVAELVQNEVYAVRALADQMPRGGLPRFGLDDEGSGENYAVVVAGRRIEPPPTQRAVRALEELVRGWASDTGLPLAYVHMGTTINWAPDEDDSEGYADAPAIIGLVIAHATGRKPCLVMRDQITERAQIPSELWDALAGEHGVELGDEGAFVAPAGWSVASLYPPDAEYDSSIEGFRDSEPIVTTSSEDTQIGAKLDEDALPASMWLHATYA